MATQKDIKERLQAQADAVTSKVVAKTEEATPPEKRPPSINEQLEKPQVREALAKALPNAMDPTRFTRVVLTAVHGNPRLQDCTFNSLVSACLASAQLGLEPNTPLQQAFLVPYNDRRRGLLCQFQIGYRGLIALALRSPKVESISARSVYEGDLIDIDLGTSPKITHKPNLEGERGEPFLWYAVAHYKGGGYEFVYMPKSEIERHRAYSKSPEGDAWKYGYDPMARKTTLIELSKFVPQAVELAAGVTLDDTTPTSWSDDIAGEMAAAAGSDDQSAPIEATASENDPAADVCDVCGHPGGDHADQCPNATETTPEPSET